MLCVWYFQHNEGGVKTMAQIINALPPTQFDPIANSSNLYINGMGLTYINTMQLLIADGICRDSTNNDDMVVSTPNSIGTTLNFAFTGLNGLDKGTPATNTFYQIFAIADPTLYQPSGYIATLNTNAEPLLPFGYGLTRRIGYVLFNNIPNITPFVQFASSNTRVYQYDMSIIVLTNGNAVTFTNVTLAPAVPTNPFIYTPVWLSIIATPNAAGDTISIIPAGTTSFSNPSQPPYLYQASIAGVNFSGSNRVLAGRANNGGVIQPAIAYTGSLGDQWSIYVVGYEDTV